MIKKMLMLCTALTLCVSIFTACDNTDESSTANENSANGATSSSTADNTDDSNITDENSLAETEISTDDVVSESVENSTLQANAESDFTYRNSSGNIIITSYIGDSDVVVIPKEIEDRTVTEIEMTAFYQNDKITEVIFPDTVKTIGNGGFNGCTSLKSVTLSANIKNIGVGAFRDCTSLEEITIPGSCQGIGIEAFMGCTALKSVVIEDGANGLSDGVFTDCTSLESIRLPQSAQTVYSIFKGENNPALTIDGIDADWLTDTQKQALLDGNVLAG